MAHANHASGAGPKLYLRIWAMLLVLTVVMIFLDQVAMPFIVLATVLVVTMLAKASMIGAFFMHLKFDGKFLALSLILGFVVLGFILYILLVPDAIRIQQMLSEGG